MAEASNERQWEHTSEVLMALYNGLLRGKDQPAFTAQQLNPYMRAKAKASIPVDTKRGIKMMQRAWVGKKKEEKKDG